MHRITVSLAASAALLASLAFVGPLPSAQADVVGPLTIRVELDSPDPGLSGPKVFEVTGVTPGPGPELTGADLIENPSSFVGSVTVDVDPATLLVTVATEDVGDFQTAKVKITGFPIADHAPVSDTLWDAPEGMTMPAGSYSSRFDGLTITWHSSPSTSSAGLAADGSAVYSYAVAELSAAPSPVVVGQRLAVSGTECPLGTINYALTGPDGVVASESGIASDSDWSWASAVDTTAIAPGDYVLTATCSGDDGGSDWNYVPIDVSVVAATSPTTATTDTTAVTPVNATPHYTG